MLFIEESFASIIISTLARNQNYNNLFIRSIKAQNYEKNYVHQLLIITEVQMKYIVKIKSKRFASLRHIQRMLKEIIRQDSK